MDLDKSFKIIIAAEFDPKENHLPNATGFGLYIPDNFPYSPFFISNDGSPNRNGTDYATDLMVEALAANIHAAHQKGFRDSAEHLRHAIKYLETLFATNCNVYIGEQEDGRWIKKGKSLED